MYGYISEEGRRKGFGKKINILIAVMKKKENKKSEKGKADTEMVWEGVG